MTNGIELGAAEAPFRDDPMRYWENQPDGTWLERSGEVGLTSVEEGKGLVTFDYDRDGDLDLFVVNNAGQPNLYRNDGGNALPWLRVVVEGAISNRDGVGARVELTALAGGPTTVQEVGVGTHYLGQSESIVHFGLGPVVRSVHQLVVTWPASGLQTILRDLPLDATILVREGRDGYERLDPWAETGPQP
jgi:hypothetical protein